MQDPFLSARDPKPVDLRALDVLEPGKDGSDYVPATWQGNPTKWLAQTTPEYRRKRFHEDTGQPEKPATQKRAYAKRFTTDYAIEWGRKQGWKLIDRERYDARTKRHHDLEGEVDAIFDDLTDGRVGVQGAGKSERLGHWRRFMAWGGPEKAKRRNLRIFYLEFNRESKTPILIEQWA